MKEEDRLFIENEKHLFPEQRGATVNRLLSIIDGLEADLKKVSPDQRELSELRLFKREYDEMVSMAARWLQ